LEVSLTLIVVVPSLDLAGALGFRDEYSPCVLTSTAKVQSGNQLHAAWRISNLRRCWPIAGTKAYKSALASSRSMISRRRLPSCWSRLIELRKYCPHRVPTSAVRSGTANERIRS